jgi:AcrR family transcriptional regulator
VNAVQPQPPTRADARRNYEHLVQTARAAFDALGPEVPMDVIARRSKVGSGTLYRHFPTRERLLAAAYRTDVVDLVQRAVGLADTLPADQALQTWIRDYFVPAQEQQGVLAMLKTALVTAPEVFSEAKEQLMDAIDRLVRDAQAAGRLRHDVDTRDLLRMAHGIATSSVGAPNARDHMLTIMFDGLRGSLPDDLRAEAANRPGTGTA